MPTLEKAKTIEAATEWYSRSLGLVFADYRGLKVKEVQELRRNLRKKGAELHVLKNTLFRKAVGEDVANMPEELHNGPTAVAFVFENETDCAKTIVDYAKISKKLKVKGGYFSGRAFSDKQIEALAALPPREVLIAQVIGAIAAPLTTLVGTIEALYAEPIRTIYAVADKVGEGAPAPESASAETAEAAPAVEAAPEAEAPAAEAPATDTNSTEAAEAAPSDPETSTENA